MSNLFNLNWKDFFKGLVMAIITAALTLVYQLLQAGSVIDWNQVGLVSITAALAYILKNLGSDNQGNPLGIGSK